MRLDKYLLMPTSADGGVLLFLVSGGVCIGVPFFYILLKWRESSSNDGNFVSALFATN